MPAYWLALIITFIVWLTLFSVNKTFRKEMLITGILITPFALLDKLIIPVYWNPVQFGFEPFVFTFFISGIASVIYEFAFKKQISKESKHMSLMKMLYFVIPVGFAFLLFYFLHLNIIYFIILTLVFSAMAIYMFRKDLGLDILLSAVFFAALNTWLYISPGSINWWNMPLVTEFGFALAFGAFVGPLYEFLTNSRLHKSAI